MRKSLFFRRVLAILLLALILWAALTSALYSQISQAVFTQIKARDLQPKAEAIASLAGQSFLRGDMFLDSLLRSSYDLFDAWIFVIDGLSGDIRSTSLPDAESGSLTTIQNNIGKYVDQLMTGEYSSLWFTAHLPRSSGTSNTLFIGVPVKVDFGTHESVVGIVFFVSPLDEMSAGVNSMNLALLFSSFLVILLMVIPVYLITVRLTRPLRQTRDVALAMGQGDFSLRADAGQRGEIGELAATINTMADKLAASIAALTLESNRLRQILEGMSDGLLAVGRDSLISQANPALQELLGCEALPAAGTSPAVLPEGQTLADAFSLAIRNNQEISLNLRRGPRALLVQIAPLCEGTGAVAGAVGLFRDVTETERLEQTRRDYVANVSHELRTPLTAMRALVEPLRDGLVGAEADRQRYYGIILQEIVRLSRLINDMLELSRLQAGSLVIPQTDMDLGTLLADLGERFALQAEDAGLTLVLPAQLADLPAVHANADRVEQVLIILVDNAIKYTPEGGQIRISAAWDDLRVSISVADTGSGIAPDDLPYVFERFYKADKAHQQPGTGLGLAIAREILQRMGQTIQARSELGQGSVFTFTLARAQVRQSTAG